MSESDLRIEITSTPTSQQLSESEEIEEPLPLIPLKDSIDKISFIQKISINFIIYFSTFFFVNLLLLLDMRMAK